jgi:hypothetical protein
MSVFLFAEQITTASLSGIDAFLEKREPGFE